MGWNFRKSINLGAGIRLNFSKKGVGISGGVPGFRIGMGPSGKRMRFTIPGTGLYFEQRLGSTKSEPEIGESFVASREPDDDAGETMINRLQSGRSNNAERYLIEGLNYWCKNDVSKALSYLRRSWSESRHPDCGFVLGMLTDDKKERFDCAVCIEEQLERFQAIFGKYDMYFDNDLELVDQVFVRISNDKKGAVLFSSEVFQVAGDYHRAVNLLRSNIDLDPNLMLLSMAEIMYESEEYQEYVDLIKERKISHRSGLPNALVWMYYGLSLQKLGHTEQAAIILRELISSPELPNRTKESIQKMIDRD